MNTNDQKFLFSQCASGRFLSRGALLHGLVFTGLQPELAKETMATLRVTTLRTTTRPPTVTFKSDTEKTLHSAPKTFFGKLRQMTVNGFKKMKGYKGNLGKRIMNAKERLMTVIKTKLWYPGMK
jgi:hypothetical protein